LQGRSWESCNKHPDISDTLKRDGDKGDTLKRVSGQIGHPKKDCRIKWVSADFAVPKKNTNISNTLKGRGEKTMSVKIRISYQERKELDRILELLKPVIKTCRTSGQQGTYKKAYIDTMENK
jgi:hypothetical protein